MKFGEYLVSKNAIDKAKLKEALSMQVDNPTLKLGEIFVSLEYMNVKELMAEIQDYVKDTSAELDQMNEWLTQPEIDELIAQLKSEES